MSGRKPKPWDKKKPVDHEQISVDSEQNSVAASPPKDDSVVSRVSSTSRPVDEDVAVTMANATTNERVVSRHHLEDAPLQKEPADSRLAEKNTFAPAPVYEPYASMISNRVDGWASVATVVLIFIGKLRGCAGDFFDFLRNFFWLIAAFCVELPACLWRAFARTFILRRRRLMDVHPFISFAVFASGIEQVLMMPLAIYLPILLLGAIIPSSSSVDYAISVAIVFVLPLSWFIAHALLWWRGGRTGMNVLNPIVLVGTLLAVLNIVCVPQALVHVLFDWQWCREALQFVGVLMFTCIFGATYWIPRLSSAFDSSSTSEKNSDSSRAPSMSLYYTKAECASWPIEKHRFYLLCKSSLVQHFSSFFGPNAGWYEPLPSGSRLTRMEVRVVSIAIELVLYWQRSAPLRSASPIVGLFMRALPNLTKNPMPMFNCARDALPQDAVETYRVWQSRYPPKQM